MNPSSIPFCPYCKKQAQSVTGKEIYPNNPKLVNYKFFACMACDAYVGTHKHTGMPLGRLANAELRALKSQAHRAFDPLWHHYKLFSRKQAYAWLAKKMNIPVRWCHIGMFNEEQCKLVIELCRKKTRKVSPIHKMLKK